MHMINKRVPTGRTGGGLHFPYNHMYMYLKKILGPPPPPIPRPPHFFSGNTKRIQRMFMCRSISKITKQLSGVLFYSVKFVDKYFISSHVQYIYIVETNYFIHNQYLYFFPLATKKYCPKYIYDVSSILIKHEFAHQFTLIIVWFLVISNAKQKYTVS